MVEVRETAFAGQHAPATVEHQQQLLVLLVLVLARDQLARTRGGLPVQLAQAVADAVLAHLVEVGAFTTAALHVCTDQPRGWSALNNAKRVSGTKFG